MLRYSKRYRTNIFFCISIFSALLFWESTLNISSECKETTSLNILSVEPSFTDLKKAILWGKPTFGLVPAPDQCPKKRGELGSGDPEFIHIPKTGGQTVELLGRSKGGRNLRKKGNKIKMKWGKNAEFVHIDNMVKDGRKTVSNRTAELMREHPHTICAPIHRPPWYWKSVGFPKIPYENRSFCVVRNPYARVVSHVNYMRSLQMKRRKTDGLPPLNCLTTKDAEGTIRRNLGKKTLRHRCESGELKSGHRLAYSGHDCHWIPQSDYVFDSKGCRTCHDVLQFEDFENQLKTLLKAYGIEVLEMPEQQNKSKCKLIDYHDFSLDIIKLINEYYVRDFVNFDYHMLKTR